MTIEYAKKELINRYKYLYENATFILAPFMYEQSEEEFRKLADERLKRFNDEPLKKPLIYLNINCFDNINSLFEEFLLSGKPMEESSLYQMVESKRNDKDYLDKVKKGLELLEKDNADKKEEMFKSKLNIWKVLDKVSDYIDEQSSDLENKKNKLYVIDQYYRILRYQNNGKTYKSGRNLTLDESWGGICIEPKREPSREKNDIGVTKNKFINTIISAPYHDYNWSIFSESEKQEIYLQYHDELPWNLEITCRLEDSYPEDIEDNRLQRPNGTNCCNQVFYIDENKIFVNPADDIYRYYQICPHCGYIVNIPKEILSDGIRARIERRYNQDPELFRLSFIQSEDQAIGKRRPAGLQRILAPLSPKNKPNL